MPKTNRKTSSLFFENPYETPVDVGDAEFFEPPVESAKKTRANWAILWLDATLFCFRQLLFFAVAFVLVAAFLSVVVAASDRNYWERNQALQTPFSHFLASVLVFLSPDLLTAVLFGTRLAVVGALLGLALHFFALRLAATGKLTRPLAENAPKFWSFHYLGRGAFGAFVWSVCVAGLGAAGLGFLSAELPGPPDANPGIAALAMVGALFGGSLVLGFIGYLFAFFPYFLAENRIGLSRAFGRSAKTVPRSFVLFYPLFAAVFSVSVFLGKSLEFADLSTFVAPIAPVVRFLFGCDASAFENFWRRGASDASFGFAAACGFVFWLAFSPTAYLTSTGRRLYFVRKKSADSVSTSADSPVDSTATPDAAPVDRVK